MWEFTFLEIAISCVTILTVLYYYSVTKHSYWRRKNVAGPKPLPIFGNFLDVACMKTSLAEKFRDLYQNWKHEPFIGLFHGTVPVVMISDLTLLKHVFVKDFTTFTDRGLLVNDDVDPLSQHLFAIDGHRWRRLRNKLSPVFTSGKLKQMYHLLCECADHFEKYVIDLAAKGDPIECKEITAKFTTDVIGSCAFGLNMNALTSEDSEFRKMGRKVFAPSFKDGVVRTIRESLPVLFKYLKIRIFSREITEFFVNSTAETISYRMKHDIVRPDFIHLLMELRKNSDQTDLELTDELIAAQVFVFFLAGFETSATTISFALYELAQNESIQEKLRDEIQEALKAHNGSLPFEAIKDLKYLDKVFQETLRKHPPLPILTRRSVNDYTIPDTTVHIPSGTKIFVPVLGLHHDPQYYPDPEVFDPERFADEAVQKRPAMAYLPFGDGPRNCIGARFAIYQTKMGIIKILKNYKVSISSNTKVPYDIERTTFILTSVGGIYLNFKNLT
ncbi:probable cytochrome P450 6a14 [Diprion similis]|uniref:probable cytochrome P450 6a14 n=1 Tax=Diprion similis TaxID=362088 RepID=UPI001EF89DAB|nr:probable cytochrome P450 6a14 [Diprion similis]